MFLPDEARVPVPGRLSLWRRIVKRRGRLSEFSERLKDSWSRINLRDRRTQLTLAGSVAALVVIVALVASSTGGVGKPVAGTLSDRAAELAENPSLLGGDDAAGGGVLGGNSSGSGSRSTGEVSGGLPSASAKLPPLTKTTMKVGIAYLKDPGAANAAAGFGNIGQVDQRRGWDAMIKKYNRNPAFGRKIVPVYYAITTDEVQSKGSERLQQEACAHYTQDNKVFMVIDGVVGGEVLNACLRKAKIPNIGGGGGLSWSQTYRDFPYLISPTGAALDRMAAFQVDRLYAKGFFSGFKDNALPYTPQKPADGKPKIGLIRYNEPSYKAAAITMKKQLAEHGLALCDGCEFEVTYSPSDIPEQLNDAQEVNAAIQNCKSKGCTHMMFLGSTAGTRITLFFVDGAEKQQYRPRLGFNQLDSPQLIADTLKDVSYPQMRQSVLVTTNPNHFRTKPPAFKACKKAFEDAGETFSGDQAANKEAQIALYCDDLAYLGSVLRAAGQDLDLQAFMNGVATMVPVSAVGTFLMQTKANRHDGAGAIRLGEWFEDCHCFKPTTGEIPV